MKTACFKKLAKLLRFGHSIVHVLHVSWKLIHSLPQVQFFSAQDIPSTKLSQNVSWAVSQEWYQYSRTKIHETCVPPEGSYLALAFCNTLKRCVQDIAVSMLHIPVSS